MRTSVVVVAVIIIFISSPAFAFEYDHKYESDDKVTLWVSKVGYSNKSKETYDFYSLPFCRQADHAHAEHKWGGLGELVLGQNELIDSQMEVKFQKNMEKTTICELELDEPKAVQFKQAIENYYWFEMFIDDLPLWGFVGELHSDRNTTDSKHMLFTHMNITIKYNKDQIIHVHLAQENPKSLEVGKTLDMTYSVMWTKTNVTFDRRFDVYMDIDYYKQQVNARPCLLCHRFPGDNGQLWFSQGKTMGKICSMLRAIDTVHHVDEYKGLLHSLSQPESRFRKVRQVMQLQLQDAKRFRYEFRPQSPVYWSPEYIYACYLVFKFKDDHTQPNDTFLFKAELIMDDISQGAMFAYLLSSPVNIPMMEAHEDYGLQELGMRKSVLYSRIDERNDGWMEVMLCKPLLQLDNNKKSFTLNIWESKYGTLSTSGMVVQHIQFRPYV